jgi:hypothetical protein
VLRKIIEPLVFNSLRVNGRLFLIYLIGFLLLFCSYRDTPKSYKGYKKGSPFTTSRMTSLSKHFNNRTMATLLNAFITGDKKKISPTVKKKFDNLALSHLFTPSGIHLASLYFLLLPFLKRAKNKLIILIPLLGLSYFFTPFHSIKRILLMKVTSVWLDQRDMFKVFLISFTWDFILGTYSLSPLSYSYSFLFLGIIISFQNRPKLFLPVALLGGQIITQYFSDAPLTTTGFIWNFALTSLFSFLYPFFFITYFFPQIPFSEELIHLFYQVVSFSSAVAISIGSFMATFNLILLTLYLSIGGRKSLIIALLLLFCSQPLLNVKKQKPYRKSHKRLPYKIIEKNKLGYKTWHSDRTCHHRLGPSDYKIKCNIN